MPARPRPLPVLLAAGLAVPVALLVAGVSGGLAPLLLGDPGAVVRFGLPLVRAVHDVAAAATIGLLLVAAFLVPEGPQSRRRETAARAASGTALTWWVCAAAGLLLSFADSAGMPLSEGTFWVSLWHTAWSLESTRLLLIEAALVLVLLPVVWVARTRAGLAWGFVLALAGLVPLSFAGHASGTLGHEQAMTGLLLHLVGVSLWVGGLIAVVLLRDDLGVALEPTVRRYSTIALWSYVSVGGAGILFAFVQLPTWSSLGTAYGLVLLAKVVVLVALGWFGWWHRRTILAGGLARPRAFLRLAVVEVAVMATGLGLGVALSRTPPPPGRVETSTDAVVELTGYPAPAPYTPSSLLTTFQPFWLVLIAAAVALGVYLAWVQRLRHRGDRWPAGRTICWVLGLLLLVYSTCGAPGVYGRVMFSMHMGMHMTLMMGVPILLVLGMPITLALRALPVRTDRTLGPREVVLAIVHSRWARVFANPVVAAVIFFGSLIGFYYTGAFEFALSTHEGHVLMVTHFVMAGYLFVWSLIGRDPGPPKWPAPIRLVVLFATLASHAFFGMALMSGSWLLAPGFFKAIDLPWVPSLLADQQLAGAIAWGVGEAPTLFLALLVTLDWVRSDTRDARRIDRQADRDGDAKLAAYNASLQELAHRGGPR